MYRMTEEFLIKNGYGNSKLLGKIDGLLFEENFRYSLTADRVFGGYYVKFENGPTTNSFISIRNTEELRAFHLLVTKEVLFLK